MLVAAICGLVIVSCRAPGPRTEAEAFRHYLCVVPAQLPDGKPSDGAVAELKDRLVKWAGGYTLLGRGEGGWWDGQRTVTEENLTFFVRGPADLQARLADFVKRRFEQQEAFVAEW